jgi:uracil-DNA glycosylase
VYNQDGGLFKKIQRKKNNHWDEHGMEVIKCLTIYHQSQVVKNEEREWKWKGVLYSRSLAQHEKIISNPAY